MSAITWEIRVKGRLPNAFLDEVEGLEVSVHPIETVLYGPVEDQAALLGILARLQTLHLEVVELRQMEIDSGGATPLHDLS